MRTQPTTHNGSKASAAPAGLISGMAATVLYLEQFVENATTLPAEVSRYLTLIKALDEKAEQLLANIKANSDQLMALPPLPTVKREQQVGRRGAVWAWRGRIDAHARLLRCGGAYHWGAAAAGPHRIHCLAPSPGLAFNQPSAEAAAHIACAPCFPLHTSC